MPTTKTTSIRIKSRTKNRIDKLRKRDGRSILEYVDRLIATEFARIGVEIEQERLGTDDAGA